MPKIFTLLFILYQVLSAQDNSQNAALMKFAHDETQRAIVEKQTADSIALVKNLPIRQDLPDGRIMELQKFENGMPVYYVTENAASARSISSNLVYPEKEIYKLTGKDQIVGVWDAGIARLSHSEFGGRVTSGDGTSATAQHSCHVCGTVCAAGVNQNAHGMADSARVRSFDWSNDLGEIASAYSGGLKVSNHSYGPYAGWTYNYKNDGRWAWFGEPSVSQTEDYKFGYYSSNARAWDNFAYTAKNILVCRRGGNDRDETGPAAGGEHWVYNGGWILSTATREPDGGADGYDCAKDAAIAKNVLSVAACNDVPNGYAGPGSVGMSGFSSWGPTDDGRIKPDITANGVGLFSTDIAADNAYISLDGTSMASPSAAGSIALLLEHQQTLSGGAVLSAAAVKGLILHTADECGPNPGPDYSFGWGLMNTFKAAKLMDFNNQLSGKPLIKEITLTQGSTYEYQIQSSGFAPLRATICWTDPPGNIPPVSLNPPNLILVNDLDMLIIGPDNIFHPWILDPAHPAAAATKGDNFRDNIEQILIDNPVAGNYTIRITHKGTLYSGSQDFALIISGISMPVPPQVELESPINGATTGSNATTLRWKPAKRNECYMAQIALDSLFTNIVFQKDSIPLLTTAASNLIGLQKYYWRVRARNSGGWGLWSSVFSFSTAIPSPQMPSMFTPAANDGRVPLPVKFAWSKANFAENYKLQVSTNSIMTLLVVNDSTLTDTTATVNTLADGKSYYWRVGSKNSASSSGFPARTMFITKLNAPDSVKYSVTAADHIKLNWADKSTSEINYYILRRQDQSSYQLIDSVLANVTSYTDSNVVRGSVYSYRLFAKNSISVSDTSPALITAPVEIKRENNFRKEIYLRSNYPNPFNPQTAINFGIPETAIVKLEVFNALGEKLETLLNAMFEAGNHQVLWDAHNHSSGIYYYVLSVTSASGTKSLSGKMTLIK